MHQPKTTHPASRAQGGFTVCFRSGEVMRSRSVAELVLHGTLDIPPPPQRLVADWHKEIGRLGLELGDVEPLPLARTIARWPDYRRCAEAVSAWLQTQGLPDLLDADELALMACLGTHYHHDAVHYGHAAFCNIFLSEDCGMDLHFPALALRIPLCRGTVVIFDTAQPHAVIPRSSSGFNVDDFVSGQDYAQLFLTWELPLANAALAGALKIDFTTDADTSRHAHGDEAAVCRDGERLTLCRATGSWLAVSEIVAETAIENQSQSAQAS